MRIRAGNAENNFRKVSKQVVEEKDLRAAADQRAGDLTAMLETAQQQLQDVERAKAAEDVVTHVAATQTYGNVVEFATQTEDVQAKEAVETCIASVQTEAMGQPDAQMGEIEKKLLDTMATRDDSVQTEVMGRPGTQTVEFATQTENGENLELKGHVSTFHHDDEVGTLKRDLEKYELRNVRMRDTLKACLREKDWAIRQSHNHISLLEAYSSYFGSLPDDYDGKTVRSGKENWPCHKCKFSVFARKAKCPQCGTSRRGGK